MHREDVPLYEPQLVDSGRPSGFGFDGICLQRLPNSLSMLPWRSMLALPASLVRFQPEH